MLNWENDCYIAAAIRHITLARDTLTSDSITADGLVSIAHSLCMTLNHVRKAADGYGDASNTAERVAACRRIDFLPKYATQDD